MEEKSSPVYLGDGIKVSSVLKLLKPGSRGGGQVATCQKGRFDRLSARMLLKWILALLAPLLLTPRMAGQELPEWLAGTGNERPPDFGVRDDNGFFNRESGAMKRIADQLRKLEADHGFRIYLLVEPVLIATSAPELAAQLQQIWVPDGNGLVVVYESDNRSLGFGREVDARTGSDESPTLVPTHETAAILLRARGETDAKLAPEAFVETLMGNLVREFHEYFERRKAPIPAGRSLRLALLTVGGLTLLALAAIGVGALVRLPSMAGSRTFRFPVVDRPERLGAPFGGGSVVTRKFRGK